MDRQLDLGLQAILIMVPNELNFAIEDYKDSEYKSLWEKLTPHQTSFEDDQMYYRTDKELFCERKLVVPTKKIADIINWCHKQNGHPGPERTIQFLLKYFYIDLSRKDLIHNARSILRNCETCLKSKPSTQNDRGLISALPIPQIANDLLYIDFVQMDPYNNFDYVFYNCGCLNQICSIYSLHQKHYR